MSINNLILWKDEFNYDNYRKLNNYIFYTLIQVFLINIEFCHIILTRFIIKSLFCT